VASGRGQLYPAAVEFGARVRARREKAKLSQEDLAHLMGLHRTYVGSVERGERNVGLRTILRFGRALGVEPATLIEGMAQFDIGDGLD